MFFNKYGQVRFVALSKEASNAKKRIANLEISQLERFSSLMMICYVFEAKM